MRIKVHRLELAQTGGPRSEAVLQAWFARSQSARRGPDIQASKSADQCPELRVHGLGLLPGHTRAQARAT